MRLGLVIEGFWKDGVVYRSLEVESFIPWFAENNDETYIINLLEEPFEDDMVRVMDAKSGELQRIPIGSLDVVYYGITGQKIHLPDGRLNSLAENLDLVLKSLETFSEYPGVKISNPPDTMLFGMSKDYLFKLSELDIPIVETIDISSIADLKSAIALGDDIVIKPKIAERGNGSVMSYELRDEGAIREYAMRFLKHPISNTGSMMDNVMSRQGLIAQRFNPLFTTIGEKKIFYVNGKITVSRRNHPTLSFSQPSLDFRKGLVERIYEPTEDERRFVDKLAGSLENLGLDVDFFRADIVSDGTYDSIRLSELELINPCSSSGHNPKNPATANPTYPEEKVSEHNRALLNSFLLRAQLIEVRQ